MGTGFRDIVLRLTEASLTTDQILPEEAAALYAEAARTIEELRDRLAGDAPPRRPLAYDGGNLKTPGLRLREGDE